MTNEELVSRIRAGEIGLMATLWEQVKRYAYKSASAFYCNYYDRCCEVGIDMDDLRQEAYLGIHMAVEKFKPEMGVKFLTYAEYRLKAGFFVAAKLKTAGERCYHEYKLEDISIYERGGETIKLADSLIDPLALLELEELIEEEYQREYQARLAEALQKAFDSLFENQRETAIACLITGISAVEYAQQRGVSRQAVQDTKRRALVRLRASIDRAALAV